MSPPIAGRGPAICGQSHSRGEVVEHSGMHMLATRNARPMTTRTRFASAVAIAALILGACGSDDTSSDAGTTPSAETDDGSESAGTAAPDSTEPADPTQDVEADTAAAEAALLALSDFPVGWTEVPDDGESNPELNRQIAACGGYDGDGLIDTQAEARTGDFTNPDGDTIINQNIGIAATEEDAAAAMAGLANPDALPCVAEVYNTSFVDALNSEDDLDGVEVGEITVARLNVTPVGDDTQAIRVVVPLSADGFDVDLVVDLVLIRVGRSLSGLAAQSQFAPIDIEILDEYNALAASRLPG